MVEAQGEGTHREGWFRSPGGVLAHADGPSQVRALTARGYTAVEEDTARREIGDGIELQVDRSDGTGTFDADAVARAIADESATVHAARSAAARKAAATRRANREAEERADREAANEESDALGPEG